MFGIRQVEYVYEKMKFTWNKFAAVWHNKRRGIQVMGKLREDFLSLIGLLAQEKRELLV